MLKMVVWDTSLICRKLSKDVIQSYPAEGEMSVKCVLCSDKGDDYDREVSENTCLPILTTFSIHTMFTIHGNFLI